ncbi:MAG: DUF4065 domain-containing protein [Opitutus sp.]|nr:DUF4065 domain-containing protein [Opitutus sp.]
MKLQKLLHDTQGYHLALFETRAFTNEIEAWPHGSVIPAVYHEYKAYENAAIPAPTFQQIPETTRTAIIYALTGRGEKSAIELRQENHDEAPWKEAWPITLWHRMTNRFKAANINENTMKTLFEEKITKRQNGKLANDDEHCFSVDLPAFREIERILAAPASEALIKFMRTPSVFENGKIDEILRARQQKTV